MEASKALVYWLHYTFSDFFGTPGGFNFFWDPRCILAKGMPVKPEFNMAKPLDAKTTG